MLHFDAEHARTVTGLQRLRTDSVTPEASRVRRLTVAEMFILAAVLTLLAPSSRPGASAPFSLGRRSASARAGTAAWTFAPRRAPRCARRARGGSSRRAGVVTVALRALARDAPAAASRVSARGAARASGNDRRRGRRSPAATRGCTSASAARATASATSTRRRSCERARRRRRRRRPARPARPRPPAARRAAPPRRRRLPPRRRRRAASPPRTVPASPLAARARSRAPSRPGSSPVSPRAAGRVAPWPAWAGLALLLLGVAGGGARIGVRRHRAGHPAAVASAP